MSTQRYISTSFWDDEWIQTLDPSEKLLYLYYMTNPLTNIAGVYKVTERRVSFDTGFTSSTIQHIMAKFEKVGKVFRHGEWIILPTWAKHQKVSDRDNIRKGIDAILKALPDDVFQYAVEKGYKYIYLKDLGRCLQGASTTSNYSNIDIESDIESDIIQTPDKPAKPKKHRHGEYKHVLLTSDQYLKLCEEWGEPELLRMIKTLDEGIETKGYKYKNHNLALRKWKSNEKNQRNGYSKPLQDQVPREKKKCPKCGGDIRGSACVVCYTNYDYNGDEI